MKVYISHKLKEERIPSPVDKGIILGKAHYSWKFDAKMYAQAIEECGYPTLEITAPDIYQHSIAKKCVGIKLDDIHLIVKPIEWVRPLFGHDNHVVSGWEFPEFNDCPLDGNPMHNHIAVLKKAKLVWCLTSFTARNLSAYGVDHTIVLPPPVAAYLDSESASIGGRRVLPMIHGKATDTDHWRTVADIRGEVDTLFVFVANPWDMRKNLRNFLTAFRDAHKGNEKAALILKLIVDNKTTRAKDFLPILKDRYDIDWDCDNVYFMSDILPKPELVDLYDLADFYFCPSSAEGLNLPLIEAMYRGTPAISSDLTAMSDYIKSSNSIVLDAEAASADGMISALGNGLSLTHYPPEVATMKRAFEKAFAMSPAARKKMGANARKTVMERYGAKRFRTDFDALVVKAANNG